MKSNKVAEITNLEHRHILRQIRKYRRELVLEGKNPDVYFIQAHYLADSGQKQPAFILTPQGVEYLANRLRPDHANELIGYWERKGKDQWKSAHPTPPSEKQPAHQISLFPYEETPTKREKELIAQVSFLKGQVAAYEKILSRQQAKAVNV